MGRAKAPLTCPPLSAAPEFVGPSQKVSPVRIPRSVSCMCRWDFKLSPPLIQQKTFQQVLIPALHITTFCNARLMSDPDAQGIPLLSVADALSLPFSVSGQCIKAHHIQCWSIFPTCAQKSMCCVLLPSILTPDPQTHFRHRNLLLFKPQANVSVCCFMLANNILQSVLSN